MHLTPILAQIHGIVPLALAIIAVVVCVAIGGAMSQSSVARESERGEKLIMTGLLLLILTICLFPVFKRML